MLKKDSEKMEAPSRENSLLRITDFGARENSPNNNAAIQNAIDGCPEKGTVVIPKGTYRRLEFCGYFCIFREYRHRHNRACG